jgi:hypothetical protein
MGVELADRARLLRQGLEAGLEGKAPVSDKPAMSIDKAEAAAALAAAGRSEQQSFSLYAYRFNAPMLVLWGIMWMAADLTIAFAPWTPAKVWAWPAASLVGSLICVAYYWRYSARKVRSTQTPRSRIYFWRMMATWLCTGAFIVGVMYVFAPFKWREPHAFWGLLIALLYAVSGVWAGWRLAALGALLGGLVMYAFFGLSDAAYLPFMGIVCGGGMALGGLWLRTA